MSHRQRKRVVERDYVKGLVRALKDYLDRKPRGVDPCIEQTCDQILQHPQHIDAEAMNVLHRVLIRIEEEGLVT